MTHNGDGSSGLGHGYYFEDLSVGMEASWDKNGDIDRASFLAEVVDGKQKIVEILPKLGK